MKLRPRRSPPASRRLLAGAILTALMLVPAASASAETTTRLSGESNTQAAIAYSQATFADGAAPTVLLARDDDFSDSLTSGAVQGLLEAPLLLTTTATLSPETLAELQRLGTTEVVILGGTVAISEAVEAEVAAFASVERVGGNERTETATLVAGRFFPTATASVVARAYHSDEDPTQAYADMLSVGNYAAAAGVPVLLTDTAQTSGTTLAYAQESSLESALLAGGTDAVSEQVEAELSAIDIADQGNVDADTGEAYGFTVTRAGGETRGGTAIALNAELGYATAADAPRVILVDATADDAWATGLTAAAQAGNGAATVLSNGPELFSETTEFLGEGADVPLLCAPRVDPAACDAVSAALGNEG